MEPPPTESPVLKSLETQLNQLDTLDVLNEDAPKFESLFQAISVFFEAELAAKAQATTQSRKNSRFHNLLKCMHLFFSCTSLAVHFLEKAYRECRGDSQVETILKVLRYSPVMISDVLREATKSRELKFKIDVYDQCASKNALASDGRQCGDVPAMSHILDLIFHLNKLYMSIQKATNNNSTTTTAVDSPQAREWISQFQGGNHSQNTSNLLVDKFLQCTTSDEFAISTAQIIHTAEFDVEVEPTLNLELEAVWINTMSLPKFGSHLGVGRFGVSTYFHNDQEQFLLNMAFWNITHVATRLKRAGVVELVIRAMRNQDINTYLQKIGDIEMHESELQFTFDLRVNEDEGHAKLKDSINRRRFVFSTGNEDDLRQARVTKPLHLMELSEEELSLVGKRKGKETENAMTTPTLQPIAKKETAVVSPLELPVLAKTQLQPIAKKETAIVSPLEPPVLAKTEIPETSTVNDLRLMAQNYHPKVYETFFTAKGNLRANLKKNDLLAALRKDQGRTSHAAVKEGNLVEKERIQLATKEKERAAEAAKTKELEEAALAKKAEQEKQKQREKEAEREKVKREEEKQREREEKEAEREKIKRDQQKREREAQEQHERERKAQEQREREAQEQREREAQEQREREAQEQREREAQEQREREAQEQREREAQEKEDELFRAEQEAAMRLQREKHIAEKESVKKAEEAKKQRLEKDTTKEALIRAREEQLKASENAKLLVVNPVSEKPNKKSKVVVVDEDFSQISQPRKVVREDTQFDFLDGASKRKVPASNTHKKKKKKKVVEDEEVDSDDDDDLDEVASFEEKELPQQQRQSKRRVAASAPPLPTKGSSRVDFDESLKNDKNCKTKPSSPLQISSKEEPSSKRALTKLPVEPVVVVVPKVVAPILPNVVTPVPKCEMSPPSLVLKSFHTPPPLSTSSNNNSTGMVQLLSSRKREDHDEDEDFETDEIRNDAVLECGKAVVSLRRAIQKVSTRRVRLEKHNTRWFHEVLEGKDACLDMMKQSETKFLEAFQHYTSLVQQKQARLQTYHQALAQRVSELSNLKREAQRVRKEVLNNRTELKECLFRLGETLAESSRKHLGEIQKMVQKQKKDAKEWKNIRA